MSSAQPQTIVIECPHCRTRYQVPPDTVGKDGRKVACAHCSKTWTARALPPAQPAASPDDEEDLDAEFMTEEEKALAALPPRLRQMLPKGEKPSAEMLRTIAEIQSAIGGKPEDATDDATDAEPAEAPAKNAAAAARARMRKSLRAFARRQRLVAKRLPAARVRRVARVVSLSTLALVLVTLFAFRAPIVGAVPDMAALYAAVGLKVNVVGLEFSDVKTLISRRDGVNLIEVDAKINSIADRATPVPAMVVTLMDEAGGELYQWSVLPRVGELEPGESLPVSTELSGPPLAAASVHLSFAKGAIPPRNPT